MPNLSELTKSMLMVKEERRDGTFRFHRIPFDLYHIEGMKGISFRGVYFSFDDLFATAGTDTISMGDDLFSDENDGEILEVSRVEYVDSEQAFLARNDNVTAYYVTDAGQSAEMGYPRATDYD